MRAAVENQAALIAISYAERVDLTYSSDQEMEKAHVQYVSGWMFGSFGLRARRWDGCSPRTTISNRARIPWQSCHTITGRDASEGIRK